MDTELSLDQWPRVSRVLDYIYAQQPTKPIKESPGVASIRGEPEKSKKKPGKKPKPEVAAEQLCMF